MQFSKGDDPSLQFQCGQQRGGHYYCSGCKIPADRTYELDYAFRCPHQTLEEQQQTVLRGTVG